MTKEEDDGGGGGGGDPLGGGIKGGVDGGGAEGGGCGGEAIMLEFTCDIALSISFSRVNRSSSCTLLVSRLESDVGGDESVELDGLTAVV